MQDPSFVFCNQLRSFCEHLQKMCSNLKSSMNQRPIPIDSSLNPFVEGLSRRATSTVKEVEALESMTIDTISFRELLGYCNELYKQNENAVNVIEDRLKEYGYEPAHIDKSEERFPFEVSSPREDKVAELEIPSNHILASQTLTQTTDYKTSMSAASYLSFTAASARGCSNNVLEDDPLFEDSISLQDLGLSDACLATLAREANTGNCSPVCDLPIQQGQEIKHQDKETPTYHCYDQDVLSNTHHPIDSYQSTYHWNDQDVLSNAHHRTESYQSTTENIGNPEIFKEEFVADRLLEVSKEEYDKTPSWLRGLASWESQARRSVWCRVA
ncbi:uncharacterized protein LOC131062952 isoform X2 [Cryptomeria japonica]|uniref:uncharacterized protein LOC131062952 isoform X2 n=1 Tax=Cryptomeria japonica TaxID=3369 RepID=UPI0027DA070F|nr:uncharacterized protein LOC131062952 isoform X2 [Cryptomeria japonica]